MGRETKRWITLIGMFGHLARMVVFALVGVFLIKAAADYSSNKAVGLDGALANLAHQSYGPFLLGVFATGLIAFAPYSLIDPRYQRIRLDAHPTHTLPLPSSPAFPRTPIHVAPQPP